MILNAAIAEILQPILIKLIVLASNMTARIAIINGSFLIVRQS